MGDEWGEWRKRLPETTLTIAREDEEDDDDDEEDDDAIVHVVTGMEVSFVSLDKPPSHGGSRPGKRRNIDRRDQEGAMRIYKDYFAAQPTYSE